MPLTLSSATARISREIAQTEAAFAQATAAVASTIATVSSASVEVEGAPKGDAQVALRHLQRATSRMMDAQADMLRAHAKLREIGREMMGPEEPWCPDEEVFTGAELNEEFKVA